MPFDARKHFEVYDFVNSGICVIEHRRNSQIVFVNRQFATLLESHPERLEGKSLDEITLSDELHYESLHPLLLRRNKLVSILGGFVVQCYSGNTDRSFIKTLKVFRVKVVEYQSSTFLIGYAREANRFERALNRLKLDTEIDPYLQPLVNAFVFVGERWKPIVTFTSPVWGPLLAANAPEIYEAISRIQL